MFPYGLKEKEWWELWHKGGEGISREERERGALAGSPFQNEKIGISKF